MSTTSENDASRSPFPLQTPEIHSQGKIDTYCDTQRLRNISSPRRRVLGELSANARQTACSCGTKCVCTLNLPSIRKAVATKPIHAPSKNPTPSAGRQANDCENNAKGLDEKDAHTNRYSNKGSRKRSIDQVDPPRLERSHSSTSRTAPICSTPTGNQRGELIDDTRADEPSSSSETMRTECSFSSIIDYDASTKPVGAGHGIATNVVKGTEEVSSDMCVAHGAAEALLSQRNNVDVTTTARKQAENLRLRLRVAMYKVRTNQTQIPLSSLRIQSSSRVTEKASPPSSTAPMPTPSSSLFSSFSSEPS